MSKGECEDCARGVPFFYRAGCSGCEKRMLASMGMLCEHTNWSICGFEEVGRATCHDCGQPIWVHEAFEKLRQRMVAAVEAAEGRG